MDGIICATDENATRDRIPVTRGCMLALAAPFELMKFELLFDGDLVASGDHNKHVEEKWEIRKAIEPQLRALWDTHPSLSGIGISSHAASSFPNARAIFDPGRFAREVEQWVKKPHEVRITEQGRTAWYLRQPVEVGGKQFLPLVRKNLALACKLNITFLRQGEPGELILPGGDLDNRIKTLFDALSVPNPQDLRGNPDHEPFFCLLEDDSLIIEQHVKTGRLLRAASSASAAHLLIEVSVNVMRITDSNIGFIGD